MGTVVQYAGHSGSPQWSTPASSTWDYRSFAQPGPATMRPDHVMDLLINKRNTADNGFNIWTLNSEAFNMHTNEPILPIERGKRYRMRFCNATDDIHPLHLHRHTFDVTHIAGPPVHGLVKDVIMLGV
ncbi:multicopper oxidase domain-containing protein [Nonomuraea sp. M3C6]|uniref:Multicopper oxidase domain-containing protein n=1 Tax=Nonomuraea marmarensis TaxID=3351344 RepID=A0ABW7APG5_9ACTN